MVLSLCFALLVALAGMSRFVWLRWVIKAYIEVMRGTPLLLQLVYIYYVLPEIGIRLPSFAAGTLALTLNYSAYLSEVYRGGIQAISTGQHDAAAALGMTRGLAMRRIVLPQAIRIILPTLGNYFIGLFKDTALCSAVSIQEVLFTAQIIAANNYQYFTLYTVVGAMYFAVSFPAARLVGYLERVTRGGYRSRHP
jgi:His/Glu/Gln/Arg/opine family amino acid ABC transporter permease subunit